MTKIVNFSVAYCRVLSKIYSTYTRTAASLTHLTTKNMGSIWSEQGQKLYQKLIQL